VTYLSEVQRAMAMLAEHPKTLFVGQAVRYPGQATHRTLEHVPMEKRIEMPVIEDFQMGFCTGLALEGYIPICIFPRFDFLLLAANQIVNHLDKIPMIGGFRPKVIIRTTVGATEPLDPGPQHSQNYSDAFRSMLYTVHVFDLVNAGQVVEGYEMAMSVTHSAIVVERAQMYL
jgi:pyruvate/2-oxoglutarate/acetoin dehydrogenase E1 component